MTARRWSWWLAREVPIDGQRPHRVEVTVVGRTMTEAIESAAEMAESSDGYTWVAVRLTDRQAEIVGLPAQKEAP